MSSLRTPGVLSRRLVISVIGMLVLYVLAVGADQRRRGRDCGDVLMAECNGPLTDPRFKGFSHTQSLSPGPRLEHTIRNYRPFIALWSPRISALLPALRDRGYEVFQMHADPIRPLIRARDVDSQGEP